MLGSIDRDGDVTIAMELLHGARERGDHRRTSVSVPTTVGRAAIRARSSWRDT